MKSSNDSVSEVLGTVLLLGIAVAIFSILYIMVLSQTFETNETYPTIVSTIVDDEIVFEHRGGNSLGLDATVPLTIDGKLVLVNGQSPTVGDLLKDANKNDKWDVGETLNFNFYDFNYTIDSEEVDATAINEEKTDTIFMGSLDIHPTSNIKVDCSVNTTNPIIGGKIEITIIITHFRGNFDLENLDLKFVLPDGIQYISNTASKGSYDNSTGDWEIDLLKIRESATLKINVTVVAGGSIPEFTQLVMLLDGSTSIDDGEWDIVTAGLANAIREGYIPHDNMVELTIVQFGEGNLGGWWSSPEDAYAQVEIGPILLNDSNYLTTANNIFISNSSHLPQLKSYTPIACAFKCGARTLTNLPDYNPSNRQVINLVTDGLPNCGWNPDDNDDYTGTVLGTSSSDYIQGKGFSVDARNFLINKLNLDSDQDEIDSLAVGVTNENVEWLRANIVWPEPGYDNWPPTGSGWVHNIADFSDFSQALNEQFEILFSSIIIDAEVTNSSPIELIFEGVDSSVTITPKEPN